MKKTLLLIILISSSLTAQIREKGAIELIPHVGYSTFKLYGDYTSGLSTINTLNFGVAGDYYFNNRWSFRSGLLFVTMGARATGLEDKLNYINVPLNANWHFGSTRKWNLNFGITPGFLTSATENGDDIKSLVNTFQLGINVGIGYKIEVTNKFSILVDYQAFSGVTNVQNTGNRNVVNNGSSFNAGAVFKL